MLKRAAVALGLPLLPSAQAAARHDDDDVAQSVQAGRGDDVAAAAALAGEHPQAAQELALNDFLYFLHHTGLQLCSC